LKFKIFLFYNKEKFTGSGEIILGLVKSGIGGGFLSFLFSFSHFFTNSSISS